MPFLRAFVAAVSLVAPASVAPTTVVISPDAVVQVVCFARNYISAGTAFRVGPSGTMISVAHVTDEPNCYIGGKPIGHTWKSPSADFSMIDGDEGPYLTIDCGGFVKGHKYLSMGFARGLDDVSVELTAMGEDDTNGQAMLAGMVPIIPGMSGGPIIDEETGRVVGVNNAENFEEGVSWSVALKNTPICKGHVA